MIRRPVFFACALFLACPVWGETSTGAFTTAAIPWTIGEKLSFTIKVGFLSAGRASLEVKEFADLEFSTNGVTHKYKTTHLMATAYSNNFVDAFYKVRDHNESWLDTGTWVSHRFEQHNQEGSYYLEQIADFDWINKRFKITDYVRGRVPKIEEGDLTIPVVDTLSALYLTRMRPLIVGEDFSLDVHSGRTYAMVVKVYRKEKVKVKAGTFECFVVEPFLKERGLFIQKGKNLQVWLTADERKLPVKMQAEIFIGHVTAELAEIKQ